MSAKEKVDKALTELKKMKPYLDNTVDFVKTTSVKVSNTALPLIQKGYYKIKTEVESQIKKYQANKAASEQKAAETPKPTDTIKPTEEKKENTDQPPKV